jgi:hypothetical protein
MLPFPVVIFVLTHSFVLTDREGVKFRANIDLMKPMDGVRCYVPPNASSDLEADLSVRN